MIYNREDKREKKRKLKRHMPLEVSLGRRTNKASADRVSTVCNEIWLRIPEPCTKEQKEIIVRDMCKAYDINQRHIENVLFGGSVYNPIM